MNKTFYHRQFHFDIRISNIVHLILEKVLVCNYGPGGNWRGASVYQQGNPGSNCPEGTSKTSAGLCA